MSQPPTSAGTVVRVAIPGSPAFQLRKGEEGLSVFDPEGVAPPLTEEEILECFRPGSQPMARAITDVEARGLLVVPIEGTDVLPERLRKAHREIRQGPGMTRAQFKQALKELE